MKLVISESINGVVQVTEKESVVVIADFDTGASAVPLATVTSKGSLIAGIGNATVGELVVGANGTNLISDSSQPTGLRWGSPAGSFGASDAENRTMSANLTLTNADAYVQFCDPGGASRDINLPAAGVLNHPYWIYNSADADETLTVKNAGGTVIGILTRGKSALFVSSNTTWSMSGGGYKQLWVSGFKPTASGGCAPTAQLSLTSGRVYDYLAFDPATIEYAYANVPMPDDYSGGTVYAKFYWTHPATTTNFGVAFGLAGNSMGNAENLDVASGTMQNANDTGGSTSYLYISDRTTAITISGTPAAGELVQFLCQRNATDATNDTLAVDAYLLGVMIWYPVA